ncbi:MAG TPA: SIMPL domain-containing protein [Acidimicrobiia bacterium]
MKSGITVTGTGVARVAPDHALLTVGATALGSSVGQAMAEVDTMVTRLVATLRDKGIDEAQVQTSDLSIWPETDRNGSPRGFRARNLVTVRMTELTMVGEILSAMLGALGDGAEVHGLRFGRDDRSEAEAEARRLAWTAVDQKAAELANLFGVTVGKPLAIVESSGAGVHQPMAKMAMAAGAAPIEPGSTEVSIAITARFAIG